MMVINLNIMSRINQQVELIIDLVKELETEKSYRGIERLVQLILQALLDLGLMVISVLDGKTPKKYSEIGEILFNMGILSENDAALLKSMAGMRNILVHAYTNIKRDIIKASVEDLRKDAVRISNILKKSLEGKSIDPQYTNDLTKLRGVFRGKVKVALLIGGRAKGYSMKGDYDIAVFFGRPFNLYELGSLLINIAKALNVSEDQIDLINLDSASPEMMLEALSGKIIYVEDEYILFELKFKALIELLDMSR